MGVIIFVLAIIGFFLLYSGVFDRFDQRGAVTAHVTRVEPENNVPYYARRFSRDSTDHDPVFCHNILKFFQRHVDFSFPFM